MRALHIVKTSDGARWAALQAAELVQQGVEVHVALPAAEGRTVPEWRRAGAHIHIEPLAFPVTRPWQMGATCRRVADLVAAVAPDVIHSHFVATTMLVRLALGRDHHVPRIFQVPGPLHLEHRPTRTAELATAGSADVWIGSSRAIVTLYQRAGVAPDRLFHSYYGTDVHAYQGRRPGTLREMLGIPADALVVGNINFMYAPKYYLGQRVGLKCHEDVIDALARVIATRPNVVGVLLGGAWNGAAWYERELQQRARRAAGDRIKVPGFIPTSSVSALWPDFTCAVHVPLSENCGGVLEPLLAGVPTIASRVGGLPELVIDGVTGRLVAPRQPAALAAAINEVLDDLPRHREMAARGRAHAHYCFDVKRTATEVRHVYERLCPGRLPVASTEGELACAR